MNTISLIGCIVGIISCIIGVSTFVSAQVTKAKQDGMQIAKLDQCVNGIEEIKKEMKEKNHELDSVIDEHTKEITQLQTEMKAVFKQLNMQK
jgi:peptidoglycan hydrolase CwlO-like protein